MRRHLHITRQSSSHRSMFTNYGSHSTKSFSNGVEYALFRCSQKSELAPPYWGNLARAASWSTCFLIIDELPGEDRFKPAGTCSFFLREAGITSLYSESERGVRNMQDNPTLSREQIDRLRSAAQLRSVRSGEVLYEPSCPDVPLFVVLDGTVSITRAGEDEKILAVREPGQFTGEMSVISGGRSLLTARVTRDGVVLEVTRKRVLSLMARDTELGEVLIVAFVARRLLMIELGEGNVILLCTNSSARTLALREFLTRNGHPFTYIDIETEYCVGEMMEKLDVCNVDITVVN